MTFTHPLKGIRPFQKHSQVLLVAGFVFIGIGIAYVNTVPTPSRVEALQIALSWWSFRTWGYHFIVAGVITIISSRWPPVSKTWGYAILSSLSAAWAMFYLLGVLIKGSPVNNLAGFLTWGLISFMWWAISGLVNPDDPAAPIMVEDAGEMIDPKELM